MKESWHACERVMSHRAGTSYVVGPMKESYHTHEGRDWQAPYMIRPLLPCNSWQCSILTHTLSHAFCANVFFRWYLFQKKLYFFGTVFSNKN